MPPDPSSRGNSDIDDQVDRYINEQRVATLISDTPSATKTTIPQTHDTQQRDRNIALSHRLLAALPHSINNLTHSLRDIAPPAASDNPSTSEPLIPNETPYID